MCRVMETYCDEKRLVWSVRLKIGSVNQGDRNNIVDRPVSKVALLFESEEVDENVLKSLPREPWVKCNVILIYPYLEGGHVLTHCSGVNLWKRLWGTTVLRILNFTLFCFRMRNFLNNIRVVQLVFTIRRLTVTIEN